MCQLFVDCQILQIPMHLCPVGLVILLLLLSYSTSIHTMFLSSRHMMRTAYSY